jgi:rRNA maturation endonuclease Nob1
MEQVDGYISKISFGGKTYALKCEIVEVYPITCPKCGASFELKYGSGQCDHCGTYYTTQFKLIEQ